ncbi:hypothetical protein M9Y10_007438, partial [Tritrichomonas musculus]
FPTPLSKNIMNPTIDDLQSFNQKNIINDNDCIDLLNILLLLLDQVNNFKQICDIGLELFTKNKENECLKKHLLDTVFSGEDYNVLHYSFCRNLYKNQIMITIQDVHQKLEQILAGIHEDKLKPPIGCDFKCIILATPLIFFPNEIQKSYKKDYVKYCNEISEIFRKSPMKKRLPPEWKTPLKIRNEIYGLMAGNNTFNPDDIEKVLKMAGDPSKIPHLKII